MKAEEFLNQESNKPTVKSCWANIPDEIDEWLWSANRRQRFALTLRVLEIARD